MARRIVVLILAACTFIFTGLAINRAGLNYNENGVYFDGVATYDNDAVVAFTMLAVLFAIALTGFAMRRRKAIE